MRYDEPKGLLEWSFSELLTANVSLWNQYKYIAFNISSCKILIISYKMLIIAGFCKKKKKNYSAIYGTLCRSVTIFYR